MATGRRAARRRSSNVKSASSLTPGARIPFLLIGAIALAAIVAYANSLAVPLIFDDFAAIAGNKTIVDLADIGAVFSPPAESPIAGRPLVNLSFAINYAIGGPNVWGFHAVNIGWLIAGALVVFGLVRRTLARLGGIPSLPWAPAHTAFAVALLWVVHPLNTEAVTYLTQRTELMMGFFYLFALYAAARSLEPGSGAKWQAAAILSVLAGIGCKETIATAPLAILLVDRAFAFDSFAAAWRARRRFYAALACTWLLLGALVAINGQTFSAGFASAITSPADYFLNQPRMIARYLWLTVWPQPLVCCYGWAREVHIADVWPHLAAITALFALTIAALVKRPRLGTLLAMIFLTLGPTSSFIPIATEVGAERRMYLALVAVVVLAVTATGWALSRWKSLPRSTALVLLIVTASALAGRTVLRNREYASALTLAQTALDRWPTPVAHYLVGVELAAAGQRDAGIIHLRDASHGYAPARFFLGRELVKAGRSDEALAELRQFVKDEPQVAEGRAMLANLLAERQQFSEAVPHYREFLKSHPRDGNAWTGLGIALVSTGKQAEAIEAFKAAVAADPTNEQFKANLERAIK
jgi:tetratricopeptide (TPR) repeat protein